MWHVAIQTKLPSLQHTRVNAVVDLQPERTNFRVPNSMDHRELSLKRYESSLRMVDYQHQRRFEN